MYQRQPAGPFAQRPRSAQCPERTTLWFLRGFAAVHRGEVAIGLGSYRVLDKPHGAVGERKLESRRMPAAEGIEMRPIVVRIVEPAVVWFLVPVGRNGGGATDAIGIGPSAVCVDRGNILAKHKGVAGAVGDVGEALLLEKVEAEEDAVAALQAVAVRARRRERRGGPIVNVSAPAPVGAIDPFVVGQCDRHALEVGADIVGLFLDGRVAGTEK